MGFPNKNSDYLSELIAVLPDNPGIYQFYDDNGTIIYVGKAKNLKKRVSSYFQKNPENKKTALLVRNISDIKHLVTESEEDALLLENNLIKRYQPRYNIRLKDDKTYPWICIKKERFPRVFKTRQVIRDGSDYFGPYTSWMTVSTLLDLFKKQYSLRTCKFNLSEDNIKNKKYKICLEYHIGNCKGPCENLVSEAEYNKNIDDIRNILKGNIFGVVKQLKHLMKEYAENYRFEDAQLLKERLIALENYQSRSTIVSASINDVDVYTINSDNKIAVVNYLKIIRGAIVQTYTLEIKKQIEEADEDLLLMAIIDIRQKIFSNAKEILLPFRPSFSISDIKFTVPQRGDKRKLVELSQRNAKYYRLDKLKQETLKQQEIKPSSRILETLQRDLQLKTIPERIECFDNSNLQGNNPVAACVVFINGKPAKREYRHYNIKTVSGPNDFASMEEIVYRRYKRLIDEKQQLPHLIVIDGGKGQLSSAVKALEKLHLRSEVPVIGIAKKLEEIYFPDDPIPLYLDKKSESLKLIQQLRDEAHRFGISFHRLKRSNTFLNNELRTIQGIGLETTKRLLRKFKSVKNVKRATFEQLSAEIGLSKAKILVNYFKSNQNENLHEN
jgi:excinuclease ABC subunit C